MARVKETPLTTQALNRFLQTVHIEVAKSGFAGETKTNILHDVAGLILPVDSPVGDDEPMGYIIDTSGKQLPTTLAELKQRVNRATSGFYAEPSEEAATQTFHEILNKALRAAEKESSRER